MFPQFRTGVMTACQVFPIEDDGSSGTLLEASSAYILRLNAIKADYMMSHTLL